MSLNLRFPNIGFHRSPKPDLTPIQQSDASSNEAAPTQQTSSYKDLLRQLDTEGRDHGKRADLMESLAEQLSSLPKEKSSVDKAKETTTRAAMAPGKFFSEDKFLSQKELRRQYATPQAQVFNALMRGLANPAQLSQSITVETFGHLRRTRHRQLYTPFRSADLERRRLNSPVWEKLISQAPHLKPDRQGKMLQVFESNFNGLSNIEAYDDVNPARISAQMAKSEMIAAYAESFTALVRMLDEFRPHPERTRIGKVLKSVEEATGKMPVVKKFIGPLPAARQLTEQQNRALKILQEYAVLLPAGEREKVGNAVKDAVANQANPALVKRLEDLRAVLEAGPAEHQNRVRSAPDEPGPNATEYQRHIYCTQLMGMIARPQGDLEQWANDMLSLVRQLPRLIEQHVPPSGLAHGAAKLLPSDLLDNVKRLSRGGVSPILSQPKRSPQDVIFEFLMSRLDDPKAQTRLRIDRNGRAVPRKHELEFNSDDIPRRMETARVWPELISHSGLLTENHQKTLLNHFRKNLEIFELLPYDQVGNWRKQKEDLLAAYAPSLVKLVEVFDKLGKKGRPDVLTDIHHEAIQILLKYGPELPADGKKALSDKIGEMNLKSQEQAGLILPWMSDLTSIRDSLDDRSQHV